jgi:hypothetical protein
LAVFLRLLIGSRNAVAEGRPQLSMRDVLTAMIKAHEIKASSHWRIPSTKSGSIMSCW